MKKLMFYIFNFKKPSHADDSELTDVYIITRYEKEKIVGITIMKRGKL